MIIKPFVDEGLGNSSYLVASEITGRAVVIDPERDVDRYIQVAHGLGLQLTHALETHLHADFVSGLRELAEQSGVKIGASAEAQLAFGYLPLREGDAIHLGDLTLGVVATPGHTPEHISFTLTEAGRPTPSAIFTGGALIVGGAARTDLFGHHLTEPLTHLLYHTIHDKLLHLPDEVAVYPTHGAGSFCNASASGERVTTMGNERKGNPLVQARTEQEFLNRALNDLPSYPTYFAYLRAVNQLRTNVLHGIPLLSPLRAHDVHAQRSHGVAIVDARSPLQFTQGHIPNAYGIPVDTPLISWAGWVIPFNAPLILIADDPSTREQAVRQLLRIGYDDLRGYLDGGMRAWAKADLPITHVPVMSVQELVRAREMNDGLAVLDVRQDAEWRAGHLPGATHTEGGRLRTAELSFPKEEPLIVHCGHTARSTVAISVLEQRGYQNVKLLDGGFSAWEKAGYPIIRDDA
ncbi:MAG: MBL fold metallo-hydrolase [Anaerolineae bacterium]|nr:MBL fold metallo-hydrolase [Anaerolineae bacterium]